MEHWPVVVIGGGPAGTATALFLSRYLPGAANDVLILEKAVHPRFKVCAGGLIPHTRACLQELEIPLAVPHVAVNCARARTPVGTVTHEEAQLCTIVRRDCFDALLVQYCVQRGIAVRQGEPVRAVVDEGTHVRVETDTSVYAARFLVGADGSGSLVRRQLFPHTPEAVARAVMVDIPVRPEDHETWEAGGCEFDFRPVAAGLRGYAWVFPCWIGNAPHWNVGVYSSVAAGTGVRLNRVLESTWPRFAKSAPQRRAFPIRCFHPRSPVARPGTLLVGDAAGVDPLMGEGISFAFEFGRLAATTLAAVLPSGTRDVREYDKRVRHGWLGRKLQRLRWLERLFYGRTSKLWFALAVRSSAARTIGLRWYNGIAGWDRRSAWDALAAWWQCQHENPA